MKLNKLVTIVWIVLGAALFVCGVLELLDGFWCGIGGGFLGVGISQIIRLHRYQNNPKYREAVDTAKTDERIQFLANKAWSWAGYLFVMIAGVGTIVFRLVGQDALSLACSYGVCALLVLYWISYWILKKKY